MAAPASPDARTSAGRTRQRGRPVTALVAALLLAVGTASPRAQGTPTLPDPVGRVNDFANLLDPARAAGLDQLLQQTEARTTAQIAVVTVPTLQGLTVEDYAERLFRRWGIGQAKVDNGVLVLVAPNEREARIEVGYGLEGVLPDGLAGEIIRTSMIPRFRDNDYAGGIDDGVRRVAEIVQRNHVLTPEERRAIDEAAEDRPPIWLMVPFFGLFIGIGGFMAGVGLGSKTGFPLLFGGIFGGIPFLMSLVPFFNAPVWILGPWAAAMFAIGYRKGRATPPWVQAMRAGSGKAAGRRSGWVMGGSNEGSRSGSGSRSSWGSGSGSSGGGGSFGGGSSGGGGASGRW